MTTRTTPSSRPRTANGSDAPRLTKHAVLTEQIREMVLNLLPGDRLPAQDDLMQRFGVSDRTVLRSLEDLQRAGWIVRRPGSGTYVTDPRERLESASEIQQASVAEKSRSIYVFAPHFHAASYVSFCADLISGQAKARGLTPIWHSVLGPIAAEDLRRAELLQPHSFILIGYHFAQTAAELIERGHRAVVLGAPPAGIDLDVPYVQGDHEVGGYMMTRYLLDLGHRRLAFAFDDQLGIPYKKHPRWFGHCRAVEEAVCQDGADRSTFTDIVIDRPMIVAWRKDASLAAEYFRRPGAPTGVTVWNDGTAIVLLGILHRAGLRVPEDISVIGFDDMPECLDSIPALTSVSQHLEWQVMAVMNLLNRPTPPPSQAIVALPQLVERASCGPPPLSSSV